MRVEISLGLLFPCALKGLPSGRQVRLDSTRLLMRKFLYSGAWSVDARLQNFPMFLAATWNAIRKITRHQLAGPRRIPS